MEEEIKEENKEEESKEALDEPKEEEAKEQAPAAEVEVEEKPLDKMTSPELKEVARSIPGVTGVTAMKKDQLLSLIKEYRGIEDEEPAKKKKAVLKEGVSIRDLKQKVIALRKDKEAAREEKDAKKVDILRRRINRLKKRTRKAVQA
jgi:cell division protein FtsX